MKQALKYFLDELRLWIGAHLIYKGFSIMPRDHPETGIWAQQINMATIGLSLNHAQRMADRR